MTSEWSIAWAMSAPAPVVSTVACAWTRGGSREQDREEQQGSGHDRPFGGLGVGEVRHRRRSGRGRHTLRPSRPARPIKMGRSTEAVQADGIAAAPSRAPRSAPTSPALPALAGPAPANSARPRSSNGSW